MKQNQFEEYLTECMGVPTVEAFKIYKDADCNLSNSTNGCIQDYDGQLMHNCISEAKSRGYKETSDGVSE